METVEEIQEWSNLDVPEWADELRFNDRELSFIDSNSNKTLIYKDVHGSWGDPTYC